MKIKDLIVFMILTVGVSLSNAEPIKIAVIDTGFDMQHSNKVKLCKDGHRDFTSGLSVDGVPVDNNGHGTNIAGLIAKQVNVDYCLIILKYFGKDNTKDQTLVRTILAIEWAVLKGVDIINYSGGGYYESEHEKSAVINALNKGIVFVAAAGNDGKKLGKDKYYPAYYDKRIVMVGNAKWNGKRAPSSNYGEQVDVYINGNSQSALGISLSGTSQSTAIISGRIVNEIDDCRLLGTIDYSKCSKLLEQYMAQ